jgi:RNA polymerase sigma-70 factor, ECF subfamily
VSTVDEMTHGGNVERFERLFREHLDAVLGYALARADRETAKDAAADTFLVAWRRLSEVPEPARAWLLGVTRRTLAGQRRSKMRQLRLVQRLVGDERGEVIDSSGETEERSEIVVALASLREPDRELLCLIAWDGLSNSEAAEVLGCSPRTLAVRLHRARSRLEGALTSEARQEKVHRHLDECPAVAHTELKRGESTHDGS